LHTMPVQSGGGMGLSRLIILARALGSGFPWFLGVGCMMVVLTLWARRVESWQPFISQTLRKVPLVGSCWWEMKSAALWLNIAVMLQGGVGISEALRRASAGDGTGIWSAQLDLMQRRLGEGWSIAQAFERIDCLTPEIQILGSVGESTGSLPEMLQQAAELVETTATQRMNRICGLIEPAVILILAVLVGALAVMMLLPMTHVLQSTTLR
jgi:type II secretory pathway component PulF